MVENPAPAPSASEVALRSPDTGGGPPWDASRHRRQISPAPLTTSIAPMIRAATPRSTWSITTYPATRPTATAGSMRISTGRFTDRA